MGICLCGIFLGLIPFFFPQRLDEIMKRTRKTDGGDKVHLLFCFNQNSTDFPVKRVLKLFPIFTERDKVLPSHKCQ